MSKQDRIFKSNIVYPTDTMMSLNGSYVTSKDEKVTIEVKEINREKHVQLNIRGFSSHFEAKKLAEVLSILLINNNGFLRENENIEVERSKTNGTKISFN